MAYYSSCAALSQLWSWPGYSPYFGWVLASFAIFFNFFLFLTLASYPLNLLFSKIIFFLSYLVIVFLAASSAFSSPIPLTNSYKSIKSSSFIAKSLASFSFSRISFIMAFLSAALDYLILSFIRLSSSFSPLTTPRFSFLDFYALVNYLVKSSIYVGSLALAAFLSALFSLALFTFLAPSLALY